MLLFLLWPLFVSFGVVDGVGVAFIDGAGVVVALDAVAAAAAVLVADVLLPYLWCSLCRRCGFVVALLTPSHLRPSTIARIALITDSHVMI